MPQLISENTGVFATIRDAIKGDSHRDFTQERIGRAITLLAIPMVLEASMESLFAIVDMFWVARLGADAVATVGLTEAVLTLLFAVAMGLSTATAAMVARRIGEKDKDGAADSAMQAILLGLGFAGLMGVLGAWFAPDVLRAMGASDAIVRTGSGYTRVIYGGSAAVMLLFLINGVFRGAGDAVLAMRVLWIANLINIVLNPLLIFGLGPFPRLGVMGSGVGTTIGRSAGVLIQLWALTRGKSRVVVHLRHIRFHAEVMLRLIKVSAGGVFQFFVGMASWIALVRIAATFGSVAVAGYTLAIRIVIFAILPSWGMANAAATLVGQNLGAKRPDRAEQSVWRAGFYNMAFLGLVALTFVIFARPLISIFTSDPAVLPVAATALRLISYGYIFYAWAMVMVSAFNGAGDTYTPTVLNVLCYWLLRIPLAWWLAFKLSMGVNGVFWSIPIADSLLAVIAVFAFRTGKWKSQKV
ncbi:MAG TPA: MATE family efflux transporter [Bryobacteraceae bacterium]|nr:MATE family efflux transporter [Bryobacteraceae bacterium]